MDYGLILDVETTGLDSEKDQIIEIGVLEFAVKGTQKPTMTRCYGSLQDTKIPLSPEIEKLTGITTAMLAGQKIDWSIVREMAMRASVVIAHNADFDRRFIQASRELQGISLHWACSLRHINWRDKGFSQLSLPYLAADHGFLNSFAHRAVFDCATTFRLIAPHLEELMARSYEREFLIKAVASPFESKDVLRQRGYRWDTTERHWFIVLPESQMADERKFLTDEIYRGKGRFEECEKLQN